MKAILLSLLYIPENNYMIEIFNDKIDAFEGLSDDEKDAYKEQNRTLITTDVVDGYKTLIEGLSDLKETGTNENGLCYYEDGKEYYEYLVRTATGSDDSVEELQKRTEDFMSECINNISRIMMKNPEILDLFYEYSFPITEPDAILQDLIGKISEDFPETVMWKDLRLTLGSTSERARPSRRSSPRSLPSQTTPRRRCPGRYLQQTHKEWC